MDFLLLMICLHVNVFVDGITLAPSVKVYSRITAILTQKVPMKPMSPVISLFPGRKYTKRPEYEWPYPLARC